MSLSPVEVDLLKTVLSCQPNVTAAWLFGSQDTGRATSRSDVDIGVLGLGDFSTRQRLELAAQLETELRVNRVDLVLLEKASPILAFEVILGTCLLNLDPESCASFVSLTSRLYEDSMATLQRGVHYWRQAQV